MALSKDHIAGAVAVASLVLNIVQFGFSRRDEAEKLAAEKLANESQRAEAEWKEAPHLNFDYWLFTGENRAICRFFNVTRGITINAPAFGTRLRLDAIKILDAPQSRSVGEKLRMICERNGVLSNDAKDWRFLLADNPSETLVAVTSVKYVSGNLEQVNVALGPGSGLLIPIGFATVRRGTPSLYAWPSEIAFRWTSRAGSEMTRTVPIRRPDTGAFGYLMDPAAGEWTLSAPPD